MTETAYKAEARAELGLAALKILGLTLEEQGRVFGHENINDDRKLESLKRELAGSRSIDIADRLDWILEIHTGVAILCKQDTAQMKAWMEHSYHGLEEISTEGMNPKQLLLTGHLHHVGKLRSFIDGLVYPQ